LLGEIRIGLEDDIHRCYPGRGWCMDILSHVGLKRMRISICSVWKTEKDNTTIDQGGN